MARSDFLMENFSLEKQDSKIPLVFAGKIKGYYTVVSVNEVGQGPGTYEIQIGAIAETEEDIEQVEQLKSELIKRFNPEVIEYDLNRLVVSGVIPMRKKKYEELITNMINETIEYFGRYDLSTGDFLNGDNDGTVSLYQMDNTYLYLSDRSFQETKEEYASNPDTPKKSIGAGLGGAALGALIGAIIWGVLLYFGFYGWLAGVIGVHLAFRFYRKNNGLFNIPGVLSVLAVVIMALFLANYFVYTFVVYQSIRGFGFTFSMVLIDLLPILQEVELMSAFMFDLLVGIGIAGLYAAFITYQVYQTSKNEGQVRKI